MRYNTYRDDGDPQCLHLADYAGTNPLLVLKFKSFYRGRSAHGAIFVDEVENEYRMRLEILEKWLAYEHPNLFNIKRRFKVVSKGGYYSIEPNEMVKFYT